MLFKNKIQFLFSQFHENIETAEGVGVDSVEMDGGDQSGSHNYILCLFIGPISPSFCLFSHANISLHLSLLSTIDIP
jgi:hypothetical protein